MIEIGPVKFNWWFVLLILVCVLPLKNGNWVPIACLAGYLGLNFIAGVWLKRREDQ